MIQMFYITILELEEETYLQLITTALTQISD